MSDEQQDNKQIPSTDEGDHDVEKQTNSSELKDSELQHATDEQTKEAQATHPNNAIAELPNDHSEQTEEAEKDMEVQDETVEAKDDNDVKESNPSSEGAVEEDKKAITGNEPIEEEKDTENSNSVEKGKGKAAEEDTPVQDAKEETTSSAPTPEPPVHLRYQLPIGGPEKRRPGGLNQRKSNYSGTSSFAGPSYSRSNASVKIQENLSRSSTIKASSKSKSERRMPTRRMSSSDIPRDHNDEIFTVAGIAATRRRSNTLSVRGEKAPNQKEKRDKSIRPKTIPAQPVSQKHSSTLMIDGQMFTIDDDLKRYRHARSDTLTTATTTHDSEHTGGGGLEETLQNGGIRNPVSSKHEPMIYDAEELDDIPPPGSYAIHPPSQRRLQEASELRLFDENGDLIRFGRLFENQRTLVIFLRHWFCPFCQMFAQSMQKIDPLPLQRADLGMIVIGQGHWHVSKSYKEVMKIPSFIRIFSDPTRKIYSALGMTLRTNDAGPACSRPDYQTMGAFKASMVAIKKGVVDMPIRMPGDVKLLGGEFILGPGLQCSFTHRMVTTRGHLDLPRILTQAGCDLSLKTPKDVLAEGDTTPRKPGSTRSVDRRTARRIARRIAGKNRGSTKTPKDTLISRNRKAAEEVKNGNRIGSVTAPPVSLSKRFIRPINDGTESVDDRFIVQSNGLDVEQEQSTNLTDRARKKFVEGMQTGFSVTAGATMYAADRAKQAVKPNSKVDDLPPPLPMTSSEDAYQAANRRQKVFVDEESSNFEPNGVMYAGSTLSLGNRGNGKLGEEDLKAIMGRSTFSSPDLHANSTQDRFTHLRSQSDAIDAVKRDLEGGISPRPRPNAKSALRSTASSTSLVSSMRSNNDQNVNQDSISRGTSSGVPLSLFERRILGRPHGIINQNQPTDYSKLTDLKPISKRFSTQTSERGTPLSATFGEDTDYKRLSRSEMERSAMVGRNDDATPNESVGDKTPKARIISLYADDFNPPNGQSSPDIPPPLPPKSPRFGNLTANGSRNSVMMGHVRGESTDTLLPNRAPVPAPTPAFAAVFAAEEARRNGGSVPPTPSTIGRPELYSNDSVIETKSIKDHTSSSRPTSAGLHSGASPALFAGLPSLNGSSASLSRSKSQPITQSPKPEQSSTMPISPFGTFSGNPLQMAALGGGAAAGAAAVMNGHSRTDSASSNTSNKNIIPPGTVRPLKTNTGSSFLEDLEPVDGLNRTINSNDSNMLHSPSSGRETSSSVDYEDEDEDEDFRGDWGPLQARQNLVSSDNNYHHHRHDTIKEEEDEDWTENETDEGELEEVEDNQTPTLALFSGFANAKKISSPGQYVVKRVTSRPSTAPGKLDDNVEDDAGITATTTTIKNSASARKIPISRLLRKPPKTAPTNAGRRLSSLGEEEEGMEDNSSTTIDSNVSATVDSV